MVQMPFVLIHLIAPIVFDNPSKNHDQAIQTDNTHHLSSKNVILVCLKSKLYHPQLMQITVRASQEITMYNNYDKKSFTTTLLKFINVT